MDSHRVLNSPAESARRDCLTAWKPDQKAKAGPVIRERG